jgi:RimJ/RimL family protein N-acetyltransferase
MREPDRPISDGVARIRRWEKRDVRCVQEARGCSAEDGHAWIHRQWQRAQGGTGLSFAIARAHDDQASGYVGLLVRPKLESGIIDTHPPETGPERAGLVFMPQPGNVGIGYWVVERARGSRMASRAVALLSRWALTEGKATRVEALVEVCNVASRRVVERAGFHAKDTCVPTWSLTDAGPTRLSIRSSRTT